MQPAASRVLTVLFSLCLLGAAGCGCKSAPDRHPVVVRLEGFEDKPAMEVHIIAKNAAESPRWEKYPMGSYWKPGDPMREGTGDAKHVMYFGADRPVTQSFSPKNEDWERLWKKWEAQRATKLFILALLPPDPARPFEDREGNLDPRRRVLPLDRCRWNKKQQTIRCVLKSDSIEVLTPPK